MSYTVKKLIADAEAANLRVLKRKGRTFPVVITRVGRGALSVVIYENGHILRNDVRLDLCVKLTPHDAAKALGLLR